MHAKLALILTAAAVALSGCANIEGGRNARSWGFYSNDSEGAKLAYGTPETDDVALMLVCQPSSGRVTLNQGGLRNGDGVTLISGGRRVTFHGQAEPDMMGEGVYVTAETKADAPVLNAFRSSGQLALQNGRDTVRLHARTGAERAEIQQFFGACGGAA